MPRYLALQLTILCLLSAFFGFKAAQVTADTDIRTRLAQLPGGELLVQPGAPAKSDLQTFERILNLLASDSLVPEEDRTKLIEGAIHGAVAALGDRYSRFIPPVDHTKLSEDITGYYGGVGILIEQKDGHTLAATVFPGLPADVAGVQAGDIIIAVNGEDVTGAWVTDIVNKIKGPVDTDVVLTVYRPALQDSLDLTVTRASVKYPSVWEKKLLEEDPTVGYIKLIVFNAESGRDFAEAVEELKTQGMKALILDLRQNTGGTFEDARQIADLLVPAGPLVYTQDRSGQRKPVMSRDEGQALDMPLAVLTDGFSASASEIVAGAVQDTRSGVLVGTKTFGKGVMQSLIPFRDGSSLILTTARYLTPNGRDIDKHGVRPDVPVEVDVITEEDPFVKARIARIEALSKEATEIRRELQEYFRDKDYTLLKALEVLRTPETYAAILAQPGPTPEDDQAAWEAEEKALAAAEAEAGGPENLMNAPVDAQRHE